MAYCLMQADARTLPLASESVDCVVTSPPYWAQRDYGVDGQIGLEDSPHDFVSALLPAFRETRRALKPCGTLWVIIGDTYYGDSPVRSCAKEAFSKSWDRSQTRSRGGSRRSAKRIGELSRCQLCGVPWRFAVAMQKEGWYLRSEITWCKPASKPEGRVKNRPSNATEKVFLFAKQRNRYAYHRDEVLKQYGADRNYWLVETARGDGNHPAAFPVEIAQRAIIAGCPAGGIVLDPFCGSGTVGVACLRSGRDFVGLDIKGEYLRTAGERLSGEYENSRNNLVKYE